MNDGAYRRRVAMIEQSAAAAGGFISNDGLQISTHSTRPVSWHPASRPSTQQMHQSAFPTSTPEMNPHYQYFNVSPTPALYSAYASPASTFSPVSLPFNGYEQTFCQPQPVSYRSNSNYVVNQPAFLEQPTPTSSEQPSSGSTDSSIYSYFDWNDFAANGFENPSTTPPTPENFLPVQHAEPAFSTEESIPYHPLSESEDEGEELIGMGLYDAPEQTKSSLDPRLDNYRTMMNQLLGSNYRRPEPTGKGLKLEETWNPPPSDDEEDDDDEQDGEGEEDDEPAVESHVQQATRQPEVSPQGHYLTNSFQPSLVPQAYSRGGWL